jgi:hypothetical protein
MESAVTDAWSKGWQPADLAGYLRRKAGATGERMIIDIMAAEMRRYAATTVESHWVDQLESLSARVWWARDDDYFAQWAQRQHIPVELATGYASRLLQFLYRLPNLPVLGALPGHARAGAKRADIDPRMLDRVRALLAKAESTDFPEEAETYSAKAQELMARHSIDYALLTMASGVREAAGGRRMQIDSPYEVAKTLLLSVTASANRCRSVWSRDLGFATVMGFPADVAATELLYTSLLVQATSAMVHAGAPADGRTASFRRSFLTGYAYRIEQRLAEATATASTEAEREHGSSLLPVLASRAEAVHEAVNELFPQIITTTTPVGNRAGWFAGRAAADRASLQPQRAPLTTVR